MASVSTGGKTAVTHYRVQKVYGRAASIVRCRLETGRTHQIRVHLSGIGCHLIGDHVYTQNRKTALPVPSELKAYLNTFPRQALHAATLGFIHPRTGQKLFFSSELPEDLRQLTAHLDAVYGR
jgi:23S rRNA pseudouridine1911/1915/1917 synthase